MNRRGGGARLIRYCPVCGLQGLAEKNLSPQEHLPSSFLLPSSDQNPLSPDFFHNLQKRVRSVRHNRYWFCFSSTSFLIFHKKPAPKKIENQKKNPIPTSIFTKPKKATPPTHISLEKRPSPFFQPRSLAGPQERNRPRLYHRPRSLSTVAPLRAR